MLRSLGPRLVVLAVLCGGLVAPLGPSASLSPAGAEATPTVPLLTGGVMTYSGTVGGSYHDASGDNTYDSTTSPVDFKEQALWEGGYFNPYLRLAPVTNWQTAPSGHYLALTSSPDSYSGTATATEAGVGTTTCTFTSHLTLPEDGSYMPVGPDGYLFMRGMEAPGAPDRSCSGSDQLYPSFVRLEEEVSNAYFNAGPKTLPTQPRQVVSYSAAITGPTSDTEGDHFTFANGTAELHCAICVSDISFTQKDPIDGTASTVPDAGTYDGNIVEITATVQNTAPVSLTVPFTFLDRTTNKPLREADGTQLGYDQTFAAGETRTITFDWDTQGTAWRNKQPLPTHTVAVVTGFGGAQRDITVLPKPVVLVHGWNSDASTWDSMESQLTAQDSDWRIYAVGDQFAGAGQTMDTDPVSGNTIETNAGIEARYVEHVRQETGAQHVDLVVHSMGGLISRDYIDHIMTTEPHPPGGRPLVTHLVMLGTPNQGSVCAYVASGPVALFGTAFLKGLAIPTIQLTPAYVNGIFDKHVRNQHGVLFSVDAGTGFPVCGDGDGDGVVTRESAWWIYADVGEVPTTLHTSLPHDEAIATQWIPDHLEKAYFENGGAPRRVARSTTPPPPAEQQVAIGATSVPAGRTATLPVPVSAAKKLVVELVASSRVSVTLVKPSGATALTQRAGSAAAARPFRSVQVSQPAVGTWKVRLRNTGPAPASVLSTAALQGSAKRATMTSVARPGRKVLVALKLRNGSRALTGATARAMVRRLGGALTTIRLRDNGTHGDKHAHDGIYTGTSGSLVAGDYYVVGKAVKGSLVRYVAAAARIS